MSWLTRARCFAGDLSRALGWLGLVVLALFGALMFAPGCLAPEDAHALEAAKAERDTSMNEAHVARETNAIDDAEFERRVAAAESKFEARVVAIEQRIASRTSENADALREFFDPTSLGREALLVAAATWLHGKRRDSTRKKALASLSPR